MATIVGVAADYFEGLVEVAAAEPLWSIERVLLEVERRGYGPAHSEQSPERIMRQYADHARDFDALARERSPGSRDGLEDIADEWPVRGFGQGFAIRFDYDWPAPAIVSIELLDAILRFLEDHAARNGLEITFEIVDGAVGSGIFRARAEGVADNIIAGWLTEALKVLGAVLLGAAGWNATQPGRIAHGKCVTAVVDANLRTIDCAQPDGQMIHLDVEKLGQVEAKPRDIRPQVTIFGQVEGNKFRDLVSDNLVWGRWGTRMPPTQLRIIKARGFLAPSSQDGRLELHITSARGTQPPTVPAQLLDQRRRY